MNFCLYSLYYILLRDCSLQIILMDGVKIPKDHQFATFKVTSITSLQSSLFLILKPTLNFVSTVSLSWCHVIGRLDVRAIEGFNILHHKVTSGCRLHVSLTHCSVLHLYKAPRPYCASPLETLPCFSSQLSPAGIKGFRESGTAYIRPKTMESRMSGEWYVTSFSTREMEILELCSFGCTAGDLPASSRALIQSTLSSDVECLDVSCEHLHSPQMFIKV